MSMPPATFQNAEKLKSPKVIAALFSEGTALSVFPLRAVWLKNQQGQQEFPARFALTVPRRAFPKAVDRNRIRRQIREAYRLHKAKFYDSLPVLSEGDPQLCFMVIYLAKEEMEFKKIEKAMQKLLSRLAKAQDGM